MLDRSLVDTWVKTKDRQSFQLARQLIEKEGLLCGGSCGSALSAALQEAHKLKKGQNCVIILADGVRNYMSKFIDDKWMLDNNFIGPDYANGSVSDIVETRKARELITVGTDDTPEKAVSIMRQKGISQLPVLENGRLVGLISEDSLLRNLGVTATRSASIALMMDSNVPTVELKTPLSALQDLILSSGLAVVIDKENRPTQILTKIDLVEWLNQHV